jgi:salicylate hydroxylase
MGELSLPNGPEQEGRDNELSGSTPCEGFPMSLMDPSFQNWLWGYNATEEAKSVWKEDLREIMP